jgi:hypothetical protein
MKNVVQTLYEKSGGKNGTYGAVSQSQKSLLVSRVSVSSSSPTKMVLISPSMAMSSFTPNHLPMILPYFHFLATLSSPPNIGIKDMTVVVSKDDMPYFRAFYNYLSQLTAVQMKQFRKRQPAVDDADEC